MEQLSLKKNREDYNLLKNKFLETRDYLGKEIEPGILDSIVYLNGIGFFTTSSCEGHVNDHGKPWAWIDFGSEIEEQEEILNKTKQSTYWSVRNYARDIAGKKAGEDWSYWDEIYKEALKSNSDYTIYKSISDKIIKETKDVIKKITILMEEFSGLHPDLKFTIQEKGRALLSFIDKVHIDKDREFSKEDRLSFKNQSDASVKLFEKFLKKKYFNS